jgi:ABC-type dipeptide/oligopeptide/nickel transport system permease component
VSDPAKIQFLAVALCIACAIIVALTAGILAALGGAQPPRSALVGGSAFFISLPVALTVAQALGVR